MSAVNAMLPASWIDAARRADPDREQQHDHREHAHDRQCQPALVRGHDQPPIEVKRRAVMDPAISSSLDNQALAAGVLTVIAAVSEAVLASICVLSAVSAAAVVVSVVCAANAVIWASRP